MGEPTQEWHSQKLFIYAKANVHGWTGVSTDSRPTIPPIAFSCGKSVWEGLDPTTVTSARLSRGVSTSELVGSFLAHGVESEAVDYEGPRGVCRVV
jgi:hypothetical protein